MSHDLFVSPHLDDAVFACADRIVASDAPVVVTIFAGFAPAGGPTAWDRECGFAARDDVVAIRRSEDRAALAMLGATAVWLDFRDDQYGEPRTGTDVAAALADVIERHAPDAIHVPRQAVFDKNGKNFVFVKTGDRFEQRDVKVEQRTESRVVISGLSEGSEIALVDPTARTSSAGAAAAPTLPASGGTR